MVEALGRALASDPLLVGAAALLLVCAAIAGVWAVRRWREPPVARLERVLARREEVVVLMHPNPDPDAMASAMAVAHLAESAGTEATLQHAGAVRHHENRAFVSTFGLDLEPIEDVNWLACREVVLVDHNEPRGFAGAAGIAPIAVVDHHPGNGEGESFTDVRPEYGACATILAEYLRDRADGDALPTELATALLFGIQSDTKSLTRGCSRAEFEMSEYLHGFADAALLDRVASPPVPAEFLDVQARAISDRHVAGSVAVSDVGEVDNVDALAAAAEELLRLQGVEAVVVLGTDDGTLHLSGRSSDERIHVGEALQSAVDGIPMSSAGGHARMGGGQLSVPHLDGIGPGSGVGRSELRRRLVDALRSDAAAERPT
ncbi:DHH family phosphoesterase [Halorarius halobius]|uniref:DHH family phosphoesterase n=1 Tax=Halorarius halobius TaxID=2962671 RepID=UPI0020CE27ED|nr:DHH family phosphoesterase [Halorarius halobius]